VRVSEREDSRARGGEKEDRLEAEAGGAPRSQEDAALTCGPSPPALPDRLTAHQQPLHAPGARLSSCFSVPSLSSGPCCCRHAAGRLLGPTPQHLARGGVDRAAVEQRLSRR